MPTLHPGPSRLMIDLHNHLLPAIDDGAPDLATSLALARIAVADGITHLVCTPHIHPGRYDNTPDSIRAAREQFVAALASEGIALQVATAAEVRFGAELMAGIAAGSIPFLGEWQGRPVLLLEFPHGDVPFASERMTRWLLQRGILPMIAHPERNKGILREPSRLRPFIEQGCLLQVTAGAVAGHFGPAAAAVAHDLLVEGRVTVLASDAHNLAYRPPILSEGVRHAARLIGEARAEALVCERPWQIAQVHFQ